MDCATEGGVAAALATLMITLAHSIVFLQFKKCTVSVSVAESEKGFAKFVVR